MRRLCLVLVILCVPVGVWAVQDVANTVHNLSVSGPGTFKSLTIDEICVFCHTPHNAAPNVPLWNHELSGANYIEYDSSTLQSTPGQPTGDSRLCLACHDGTVALGAIRNLQGGQINDMQSTFLTGRANLSTDLADDHPVSFPYDLALQAADGELANPLSIDLPLEGDELQCTSCHDPHEKDIVPFLHKTTLNGELCTTCHIRGGASWTWTTASHATSPAQPTGANPWAERKPEWRGQTVAENACFNCHTPHNASVPERLTKDQEENTCYLCHNGSVAGTDIQSEIAKPFRHPVNIFTGIHDPVEDFAGLPPLDHVECADCHNPHAANDILAAAPAVPGQLLGVKGITANGGSIAEAENLYEVCFKCHADNNVGVTPVVTRLIPETNTRIEFDLGNQSYHPVEGQGQNPNVPSLIPPLAEISVIYCTDCHNNDSGPGSGGTGPRGPHGSIHQPLLERNYTTADNTSESTFAYALCYKCHDRDVLRSNNSGFPEHDKHVRGADVPCSACHDPHGVTSSTHLINFDATIVSANLNNVGPTFIDNGMFSGECSLLCHGENHTGAPDYSY